MNRLLTLLFLTFFCTCASALITCAIAGPDACNGLSAQPAGLEINVPDGPLPWTSLDIEAPDGQFQFAIVTDRTGGLRPGIFSEAVDKLNLLRPPFVMSVGDLITGYTRDLTELNRQWDEFDAMVNRLEMPFFYVPGNHDITNAVMDSLWTERLGPKYYHFVYQDVLFLCLNSEDQYRGAGKGTISDQQYDYIEKVLADNDDVRWTFVFLHQPLWDQENAERWADVETLLSNREHNVFAGHVHHYQKFQRNNGRYYTLATTGGGSGLRGPRLGEFDHVSWVTMTADGPVMANIALDGIHSDSITTREDYNFFTNIYRSNPVRFEPILAGSAPSGSERVKMQFHNPADLPMHVKINPGFSFDYLSELPIDTLTVPPNNVVDFSWEIRSRSASNQPAANGSVPLKLELSYDYAGSELTLPLKYMVAPQMRRKLKEAHKEIKIDGSLSDWKPEAMTESFGTPGTDGHVSWGVKTGKDHLYFAVKVQDADVVVRANETAWQQDYVAVLVNADPLASSMMNTGPRWYRDSYILLASPDTDAAAGGSAYQDRYEDHPAQYVCRAVPGGYVMEAAIPLAYVTERQGDNWRNLRINISTQDEDPGKDSKPRNSWMPDWRGANNVIGSGLFFKD
ncbi:hypothetical protein FUA23_19480 [Neolewinella aurantiaca]|uniref:Calcineurin-like phosphoesterase domain-containing protein n=1 Tax=Neolewinella aurantiaca TaxID=2602767 RepID=A0A5C7F6I9_9BACT|nr:metallophosphoesterase [Neolewinella aurantiaca]TXF86302.1 hypothetical protein FUA23_19480 [Neolewinella aurantiaca]